MKVLNELNALITMHLERPLLISIPILIILKAIVKQRYNFENAITIIKCILIAFSFLSLFTFLTSIFFDKEVYENFIIRATGSYGWAFLLMLSGSILVPLLLFVKKIGRNIYLLFLVVFFMNIGWLLDTLIIYLTNSHREYLSTSLQYQPGLLVLKGIVLTALLLVVDRLTTKRILK